MYVWVRNGFFLLGSCLLYVFTINTTHPQFNCVRIHRFLQFHTMPSHQTPDSNKGLGIVIIGVSGSGKSTVAKTLAKSLGCSFFEADDFHSQANKEKMSKGIPLTDEDRTPWLETLRDAIRTKLDAGETVTVTCSALQKRYREILRSADPEYKCGDYANCKLRFVCLEAPTELLASRITVRSENEKHFMPVSLLKSQLELLQIDRAEGIDMVDTRAGLEYSVDSILSLLATDN